MLLSVLAVGAAHAGLTARLNLNYDTTGHVQGENATPATRVTYNTKRMAYRADFGYEINNMFLIGASYLAINTKQEEVQHDLTPTTFSTFKVNTLGALFGYRIGYLDFNYVYFLSPTMTFEKDGGTSRSFAKGAGWEFNAGYIFPVNKIFSVGPRLAYRKITWEEFTDAGATIPTPLTYGQEDRKDLSFYLAFQFNI